MKSRLSLNIRRCRPLLGTFVEIAGSGTHAARVERGIGAGFLVMTKVHRLMCFHDRESELSRTNRHAFYKPMRVHPWMWRVLQFAREFSRNSDGIFDITMARHLVNWNYLPRFDSRLGTGSWRDIIFEKSRHVRFRRPLTIDLGGIAKGFAVDCAVDVLKRHGIRAGIVNAGGDLRVFGTVSQLVHLRHPAEPKHVAGAVRLRQRALATSAIYFTRKKNCGRCVSPLLDGRTGRAASDLVSVTVGAANCMTADALTKIVFALREGAAPLLARYRADAVLLERDGAPAWMFHSPCDTPPQA